MNDLDCSGKWYSIWWCPCLSHSTPGMNPASTHHLHQHLIWCWHSTDHVPGCTPFWVNLLNSSRVGECFPCTPAPTQRDLGLSCWSDPPRLLGNLKSQDNWGRGAQGWEMTLSVYKGQLPLCWPPGDASQTPPGVGRDTREWSELKKWICLDFFTATMFGKSWSRIKLAQTTGRSWVVSELWGI